MMKPLFFSLLLMAQVVFAQDFSSYPVYPNSDLGLIYSPQKSSFRLWSPMAEEAKIRIYKDGLGGNLFLEKNLEKSENGTWFIEIEQDLNPLFYTFQVKQAGKWLAESPDLYAKALGVNGKRAAILDINTTNPAKWSADRPVSLKSATDAIIYELHVRDASIHPLSGVDKKGTFLGLSQENTHTPNGTPTALNHIKKLGVTHVHLLPIFDYASVDEQNPVKFNWGYDPLNYNAPEGSYSTNAYDPATRIKELKTLVQTLHKNNIGLVMDVVYNHTRFTEESYFNQLVPHYYYRQDEKGKFSNASACGNETASERPMMRQFMLESLKYWLKEYHLDGFRFDLMGIHDIETMNLIASELRKINPNVLLYGEGWTAGNTPLPENQRAIKKVAYRLDNIAVFNDDTRDGLKGGWFDALDKGFVSGKKGMEESLKLGIVGGTAHPQLDFKKVNYSKEAYTTSPAQIINYSECHDNQTLWDRLTTTLPDASEDEKIRLHILANTLVFTSQGIAFMHAGAEFLRTKNGIDNSFESSDEINRLDWERCEKHKNTVEFYQKLLHLRRNEPFFRLQTAEQIAQQIQFLPSPENTIVYTIKGSRKTLFVAFNANKKPLDIVLPKGSWKKIVEGQRIDSKGFEKVCKSLQIAPQTAVVLER